MSDQSFHGVTAEFDTPRDILHAAEKCRDAGYSEWDVYTPFPIHGMDDAMGLKPTVLPWIVLTLGLSGASGAMLLQWWASGIAYPMVIAGKPFFSWPAYIPITFEGGVLLASFGAVFGMLHLCRLPRHHHSMFKHARFTQVSDDKFFITIESTDPKFDAAGTADFLESVGGKHVALVEA